MKTTITTLILVLAMAGAAFAQEGLEVTAEDLYYEARGELRDGNYLAAAEDFARVADDYPDDDLAPKALYWQAFALSREGDRRRLLQAKTAIERQFERYPGAARRGDSAELAIEIQGALARLGDADAAAEIARLADEIRNGDRLVPAPDAPRTPGTPPPPPAMSEETRMAALNALLQTSPDRAAPILRKVLIESPEKYSPEFRARAVFLLSQKADADVIDTFVQVIRNDPHEEVRAQAVFWLGQTGDPAVVDVLSEIARRPGESEEIRGKAVFALSQVGGQGAVEVLRDIALDQDVSTEVRANAVFWLGQSNDERSVDFLAQLYRSTDDPEIKDKAIFSISQSGGAEAREFLTSVVRDEDEPTEARKQALFWMSQLGGEIDADVVLELFREVDEVEVREQAIFALSQLGGRGGVDALLEIARDATDQELREKAIFWLGQSNDPRAIEYLTELIGEEDF